jgi:hypothetical protein
MQHRRLPIEVGRDVEKELQIIACFNMTTHAMIILP